MGWGGRWLLTLTDNAGELAARSCGSRAVWSALDHPYSCAIHQLANVIRVSGTRFPVPAILCGRVGASRKDGHWLEFLPSRYPTIGHP